MNRRINDLLEEILRRLPRTEGADREAVVHPGARMISVISGVHGDERSGPVGVRQWLSTMNLPDGVGIVAVPQVAPTDGDRLKDGRNLNRDFEKQAHPLTREVRDVIDRYRPVVHVDFHEDVENKDAYIFARKDEQGSVGRALAKALGVKARAWSAEIGSSEDVYAALGVQAMTVEVPPTWSFKRRVAFVGKALDALVTLTHDMRPRTCDQP
jgi:predicted deacylase